MKIQLFIFATLCLCIYADYSGKEYQPTEMKVAGDRRPFPGHFCKCFKHMVDCVKRHRNSSIEMNPEKFIAGEMFHSDDPMSFEDGEEMTVDMAVEKKNGSKGNHTAIKKCIHGFMKCVHRRPGPPGDERPEEGEMPKKKPGFFGKMKAYKNKMKGFLGKVSSKFGSVFGKIRGKFASKFGHKKGGKKMGKGPKHHHGHHHHGRHHHHHHRKGPFYRCYMGAKMCKYRARGSRRKMKACMKMFVKCILGKCNRGPRKPTWG